MPASEMIETIETLNLFGEDVTLLRCEDDTCRQWAPALVNCGGCCRKMLCATCYHRHQEARGSFQAMRS